MQDEASTARLPFVGSQGARGDQVSPTLGWRGFVSAALGVVLAGIAGVSAAADVRTTTDAPNDMASPEDIRSVTVAHHRRVRVTIRHRDLRDVPFITDIWFDTQQGNPGPEFRLSTNYPQDMGMMRMRSWQRYNWKPVRTSCEQGRRFDHDFAADVSWYSFPSRCLAAERVRVAVSIRTGTGTDWAPARRQFGRWVHR